MLGVCTTPCISILTHKFLILSMTFYDVETKWKSHIPYTYMELLVSQIFGDLQLTRFLIGDFWVLYGRNPCLQPKWCAFNLELFVRFAKPSNLNHRQL